MQSTTMIQVPHETSYIPHKPSLKQEQFLRLRCREALYGGRAGCGKSDALLMAAAQGLMIPDYSAIIFRRTYRDLALPGALMDRAHKWWASSGAHWSQDDKTWTFPTTGARIGFGYLEHDNDLARYQSAEFQFIGFDEQTQFMGPQITYMFSRLRRTLDFPERFPLRVRGATNPGGVSHEWHVNRYGIAPGTRFPDGAAPVRVYRDDGTLARVFVPAHASDNPGLDWVDYEKSLTELDPIKVRQLRDGEWIQDSSGLVYHAYPDTVFVDALPTGAKWDRILSIDVGASGNTAFAIHAICPWLQEVYLEQTMEPKGCDSPDGLGKYAQRLDDEYHFVSMVGDHGALGKGYFIDIQNNYGLPVKAAQKQDKPGHIMIFNGALASGRLRVVRGSTETWQSQASTLLWKDDRRIEEMKGMPNHSCDAALYGFRDCKHYTASARPVERDLDPVEQAEEDAFEAAQSSYQRDGMRLPSLWG